MPDFLDSVFVWASSKDLVVFELKQLDKLNVQFISLLLGHDFVEVEPSHIINHCDDAVLIVIIFT